jgi:hypothetical protein
VCQALGRLGVEYLYTDPVTYFNLDNYASLTARLDLSHGFEPVDQGGGAAVYRITACG